MIYTTKMLLEKYADYANPYSKIKRECKEGRLTKIVRGLYEDDRSVSAYLLSGYILGPSYVSFEYVLSLHGLIPEYVPNVTCASFKKQKTKTYETPAGTFIFHDVPASVFYMGTISGYEKGYSYLIACPEKALCDELYYIKQVHTMKEFKELVFDNLRVDEELLMKLDISLMIELAREYRRSNLNLLIRYLEEKR